MLLLLKSLLASLFNYMKDADGYLSLVQVNRLQVRIIQEADDSSYILPTIQPRETLNGSVS